MPPIINDIDVGETQGETGERLFRMRGRMRDAGGVVRYRALETRLFLPGRGVPRGGCALPRARDKAIPPNRRFSLAVR